MAKKIFVVSRYLGRRNQKNIFHFIGYFNGVRVRKILVDGGQFEHGEDYVLALNNIKCEDNVLVGQLAKSKRLFI